MSPPLTAKLNLPFSTVLIANRGEVAIRLIRAVHDLHLQAVAVFVSDDANSPHIRQADQAVSLGSSPAGYSDANLLLRIAQSSGAGAVLPGYGFISEDPDAATLFESAGIVWAGPNAEVIRLFGLKHTARTAAHDAQVPTVPGSEVLTDVAGALQAAELVGYPALLKSSAGGGGMGQAVVQNADHLRQSYDSVVTQSQTLFSNPDVYLERYVIAARHIEVQIFGDGKGNVIALGDRDCSVQRRRQKVIEEGPAVNLSNGLRTTLREAAVRLCAKHCYRSAGTVEFILDATTQEWFFLEVNTRLQVEHGVTELVSGVDIVKWMVLLAGGAEVLSDAKPSFDECGAAIEARIYAENPVKGYVPCPGTLSDMIWPEESTCEQTGSRIRVDKWAERGISIPSHYDPLLGKVLVWGKTRQLAIIELQKALKKTVVRGVPSNLELLLQITCNQSFLQGLYTTSLLNRFSPRTNSVEVIQPGLQSSLQDYPGRVGFWNIGVSPSGPMDAYAMGMANALVGNSLKCSAIEITVTGPTLQFHCDAVIALAGSQFEAELENGRHVCFWTPFKVRRGSSLIIKQALGRNPDALRAQGAVGGSICYLAIRGGFNIPQYLGSAATFPTGHFGGLSGSFLVKGDFLPVAEDSHSLLHNAEKSGFNVCWPLNKRLPANFVPSYDHDVWEVGALCGPHASSDFFQDETLESIWYTPYVVHHAKNRLGARLIGPAPKWTRTDGGSAGLHPSNLHDYTYAPGAVNFSGNTPIVLMLDGPSLGGFVCPITVASAELWKVAQANPGEKIKFKQVDVDEANIAFMNTESAWTAVRLNDEESLRKIGTHWCPWWSQRCKSTKMPAILTCLDPQNGDKAEIKVVYRMSGDEHLLIEYGDIELDLAYRLRVHMLMEKLDGRKYISELCPGVRSLLVRYDRKQIHVTELVRVLTDLEVGILGSVDNVTIPSRVLKLPLAFDDKWTKNAQERYRQSVRPNAPYLPSNAEFVRRINGLDSLGDVQKIMTSAQYMVLGLGDVYLGAPCAVPVDPRHRLVTSKYNPARTFTPEGAVGVGGAYMCIYGMDSPGGYQLLGRTLPIWDSYGSVPASNRGAPAEVPWLFRFFDRIEYFLVSDDELEDLRLKYRKGDYKIEILYEEFSYPRHVEFCESNKKSIADFDTRRKTAYEAERSRWEAEGEGESIAAAEHAARETEEAMGQSMVKEDVVEDRSSFSVPVAAGMAANVWAVMVADGDQVKKGDQLFSLESMKVEIGIEAPVSGTVRKLSVEKGASVKSDKELCVLESIEEDTLSDVNMEYLRNLYRSGIVPVARVIESCSRSAADASDLFSSLADQEYLEESVRSLERAKSEKKFLPLHGIPFVIADNITASHLCGSEELFVSEKDPSKTDPIVQALFDAGAILIGKTKIDVLNVGNTGTECCHPLPENPVFQGHITGGNGAAAAAVRKQIACFAIVIDRDGTASAAPILCSVLGLKVTEGLLPTFEGQVPCEGLDCMTIFGNHAAEMRQVLEVCLEVRRLPDKVTRPLPSVAVITPGRSFRRARLAIYSPSAAKYAFETSNTIQAYNKAVDIINDRGYVTVQCDMTAFSDVATLFNETGMQYIRLCALKSHVQKLDVAKQPSIAMEIVSAGEKISTDDLAGVPIALERAKWKAAANLWKEADAALLPFDLGTSTLPDVLEGLSVANRQLSRLPRLFTAMDLCSLTLQVPGVDNRNGPRGVYVVAPAFQENLLLDIAARW